MLRKMVGRLVVVLVAGVSTLAATQTAAHAAGWEWCPAERLCFATGLNGEGTHWWYAISGMRGGVKMGSAQRNQISSVYNRTVAGASIYDNPNCVSENHETVPGQRFPSWQDLWINQPMNLNEYTYDRYFATTWDNRAQSFSSFGTQFPDGTTCAIQNP